MIKMGTVQPVFKCDVMIGFVKMVKQELVGLRFSSMSAEQIISVRQIQHKKLGPARFDIIRKGIDNRLSQHAALTGWPIVVSAVFIVFRLLQRFMQVAGQPAKRPPARGSIMILILSQGMIREGFKHIGNLFKRHHR